MKAHDTTTSAHDTTTSSHVHTRCSRRRVLAGTGAVAAAAFAGCLGDDDAELPAEPIALDGGKACFVCGMIVEEHHGPAGQLFYADGNLEDHDGPAWFDSLVELEAYHEERAERGWELREAFVTDYSTLEYELTTRDGRAYISSHVDAADFADATELFYVVGSDVEGAMGEDYLPFSVRDDAVEFTTEHGGDVRDWDDLFGFEE